MKLIYALVLTLLASAPGVARAGDAASFRSLGFSGNGKYYAFLEFGTQDGSGFAYADVSVVDVAKNTIARSRSVVLENEKLTPAVAVNRALDAARLADFGITAGANPGRTVVLHSRDDTGRFDSVTFSPNEWRSPAFELKLDQQKLEDTTDGKWCTDMGGPLGLRLTIHNIADSAAPTVLQEDRSLPKSRGCVTEYSIAQVILNGTDLVVLVRKASVGFEGSDYRYLAVTGQPKLEE